MSPERSQDRDEDPRLSSLRAQIDAFVRKKGMNSTGQRRLIIDEFLTSREHVTLEEMTARVKARDPSVGFTTVYRTLRLLVECGVAEEHQFGDRTARYELASAGAHHDHLICQQCGRIFEFQEPRIEALQDEVAARFGFRQRTHKLEIYGDCVDCIAAPHRKEPRTPMLRAVSVPPEPPKRGVRKRKQ